ncbi:MAG: NADH-quinone oxidoreductase subunit L, partial [Anaerolineae bacterium]|nr:NADH-quinone oxidoreductase subunit L [Anaerolineae bacterium]
AVLGGIYVAYLLILRRPQIAERLSRSSFGAALHGLWFAGWGFDWLYDRILVRPFVALARANKDDVVDLFFTALAWLGTALHRLLSRTQTGRMRWYAAGIALGAVVVVAMAVLL